LAAKGASAHAEGEANDDATVRWMQQSYAGYIAAMGLLFVAFAALLIQRFRILFVHSESPISDDEETAPEP
jgi:hypothetical protein